MQKNFIADLVPVLNILIVLVYIFDMVCEETFDFDLCRVDFSLFPLWRPLFRFTVEVVFWCF